MSPSAAQLEARRQFALAFSKQPRPNLDRVLGSNWSVGLEVYRLTDEQYFQQAVKVFNKRIGIAHFAPTEKQLLFHRAGIHT
ncbi:hypothetical protein [Burkholderia vietnamiensis]|uniref:hypothetical protein n=1 Tax=Burkholderia vietnamiensis TaxID=60552 RepID=UPI00158BEF59|nr:hypothetical protein [Burkholderia vietnamiensis]